MVSMMIKMMTMILIIHIIVVGWVIESIGTV